MTQVGDDGGRADIDGEAVDVLLGIAGLDGEKLLPGEDRGDAVTMIAKEARQGSKGGEAMRCTEAAGSGLEHAMEVGARIIIRWCRKAQGELANVRRDEELALSAVDHDAMFLDERGGRDGDGTVSVNTGLASEPPPPCDL
jgi:hypothetical protein